MKCPNCRRKIPDDCKAVCVYCLTEFGTAQPDGEPVRRNDEMRDKQDLESVRRVK